MTFGSIVLTLDMAPATKRLFFIFALIAASIASPFPKKQIDEQQNDEIDLSSLGAMLFGDPDESVGIAVRDWTPDHHQNPEELGTYLEGDILVPGIEGRNGLVDKSTRWPNGVVPYVFASNVGSSDRKIIQRAIDEYHSKTCLRFVKRTNEKDYLSFESSNTGCWSSVGRVGKKQSLNLQSPGCTTKIGTPQHEIMHALGFLHEQNRYDRDGFVRINKQNIKPGETRQFRGLYNIT